MFEMVDWIALFAVVVCFFCLFCMAIAMLELVNDFISRRRRDAQAYAPAPQIKQTPAPVEERVVSAPAPVAEAPTAEVPVTEAPAEEAPIAEVAAPAEEPAPVVVAEEKPTVEEEPLVEAEAVSEVEAEEGTVSFSASTGQTLEEKYMDLPAEQKRFYDDIIKYAAGKEGSRRYYNLRYEEYKIGSKRIVRLRIKRGVVYCEFMLTNSDFRNYISENKIPVKQSATVIKVVDAATVDAVKNSIDIAVQLIAEEKEYKKQLAREKRRQARLQASEQSAE